MKTTDRGRDSTGHLAEQIRRNQLTGHAHIDDREEQDHPEHDHRSGAAEYVRLGLIGIIVITSLTGWWRPFMNRDWLAFAGTVIGGFPIYKEAWENLLKRRMTMELRSLFSSRNCLRAIPSVADEEQLRSWSMLCLGTLRFGGMASRAN
jgi:cation transport ATPase